MARETKKEHFVPESYLVRFANDGRLWVFDKIEDRIYGANINDVAQQRYFYDLPDALNVPGIDIQMVEKRFAREEGKFRLAIDGILDNIETQKITRQQRHQLCPHIVMQWLRTRECREDLMEVATKFTQTLVNELTRRNFPDIPQERYPKTVFSEDSAKMYHYWHMFENPHMSEIIRVFLDYIWIVGVNNTQQPLYTSDNPIVRQGHASNSSGGGVGICSKGIEFIYPLSPKYVLLLQERSYFSKNECHENATVELTEQEIKRFNVLHLMQSSRQIFCSECDFEFVQTFKSVNSELFPSTKERSDVTIQPVEGRADRDYIIVQERSEDFSI